MASFPDIILNNDLAKISVSAILGGIGFKIVERFLNAKEFVNEQTTLRAELRDELNIVKAEVQSLRDEADEWRERYYEQVKINTLLQRQLADLRSELDDYRERISLEHLLPPEVTGSLDVW